MLVKLKKGRETLHVTVDDDKISRVLTGADAAPLSEEAVDAVIEEGIARHCPADIAEKKIAVIIPDNTRLWARGDRYVPTIIRTLQKMQADPQNIVIVIALGTHADIAADQFPKLAGSYSCRTISVVNSANRNRDRLVDIGKTHRGTDILLTKEVVEADHIIIFGGVLHHIIAGFGGGRKYLFPGVAGYDSIQQNHSLTLDEKGLPHPLVRQCQLDGNPVNEDIEETCDIFLKDRSCLYVSVAVNGEGNIFHAMAGELRETFRKSCSKLNEVCTAPIKAKGDFVICSAGGHRTDGQLYQATKALFNGVEALKKNGSLLLVAECAEGCGNPHFAEMLRRYRNNPAALGEKLRSDFDMPAYVALRVIDLLRNYRIGLHSGFSKEETEEMGFSYVQDVSSYVKSLSGTGYIIPFAENILPIPAS